MCGCPMGMCTCGMFAPPMCPPLMPAYGAPMIGDVYAPTYFNGDLGMSNMMGFNAGMGLGMGIEHHHDRHHHHHDSNN